MESELQKKLDAITITMLLLVADYEEKLTVAKEALARTKNNLKVKNKMIELMAKHFQYSTKCVNCPVQFHCTTHQYSTCNTIFTQIVNNQAMTELEAKC